MKYRDKQLLLSTLSMIIFSLVLGILASCLSTRGWNDMTTLKIILHAGGFFGMIFIVLMRSVLS